MAKAAEVDIGSVVSEGNKGIAGTEKEKIFGCFFFGERSKFISSSGTIGNIFTSGAATSRNITDGVREIK